MQHKKILTSLFQMASATFIPIDFLLTRGQSIKVYSQIVKKADAHGFVLPHFSDRNKPLAPEEGGYVGAFVLDPITGLHSEPQGVVTYDF